MRTYAKGVCFLDSQHRKHDIGRQVVLFYERVKVVRAKRVKMTECPKSLLYSCGADGLADFDKGDDPKENLYSKSKDKEKE